MPDDTYIQQQLLLLYNLQTRKIGVLYCIENNYDTMTVINNKSLMVIIMHKFIVKSILTMKMLK